MKVIKRDGRAVDYDRQKIAIAIGKANKEVSEEKQATKDDIDAISINEEIELKETFKTFYDKTGITPAVMTTDNYPVTLKRYAYDSYVRSFSDERHWLIVYYKGTGNYWAFEGIQGDETDTILSESVTTRFNKIVYNDLTNGDNIATALNDSFNNITPNIMKPYFTLDSAILLFAVVWIIMFTTVVVIDIKNLINKYRLKDAIFVGNPDKMKIVKCPFCDTEYYENTIKRCLKCGGELPYEDILSDKGIDKEETTEHLY